MSEYVVLARKYRPQKLDDLVGQSTVSQTLKNAISLGRVPHALLLTGTRGVGKTTTARILAKALNCEKGPTDNPCEVCSNCKEITAGRNVDVFEIDGASNTSVDDIRELKENVQYAPSKSRFKIYIIDEVHMLSTSAFNALLKTLEEPPAGVYFIFATTEAHKIPDTILSRCQRFDFRQITEEQIAKHLASIMKQENISISDQALQMVARAGNGSLRDALSLLDQVIAFSGENITDEDVVFSLGLTDRALLSQTLEAFCQYDQAKALQALSHVFEKGFDPKTYLLELWEKLRWMILFKTCGSVPWVVLQNDEEQRLKEMCKDIASQEIERWFDLLKNAISSLSRVEFPRYTLEVLFIRITRKTQRMSFGELIDRIEQLQQNTGPQGGSVSIAPNKPSSSIAQAPVAAPSAVAQKSLPQLFQAVTEQKPQLRAVIASIKDSSWSSEGIRLVFAREFMYQKATEPEFKKLITQMATQMSREETKLVVELEKQEETKNEATKSSSKPIQDAPVIQKAISLFDVNGADIKIVEE